MSILINFLTVLAWMGMVLGGLLTALRLYSAMTTTHLEHLLARTRGYKITHPIGWCGSIFIVSFAFLVARYTA